MDGAVRKAIRKSFVVVLLVAAVGVGFVVHGSGRATPHHTAHAGAPTAADLMRAASTATAGIYLQYDGITTTSGSSHGGQVPITSFQFGVGKGVTIANGTRAVNKPSVSEITLTHTGDKYSVPLLTASLSTSPVLHAGIYFSNLNAGGHLVDQLQFDLRDAIVSGYSTSSGGDTPTESISINFTAITVTARYGTATPQTVSYNLLTQSS